ncbi:alpha-xenorhabdolysin family binary toxin subunit A [Pseudomonas sp. KU43P]|uniref:alpha-xenorhabdolysin family binary toxin subunit A n=1 Tax=Pseudomonas sp. KU43P TaxID=2487887 RepID=UPI0012A96BFD|nr:alpha-xenorhabdolysin family binary toxin subunit A [Pseudomonas sp. KU43P]BBH47781.1 hypothetical protein KU43P_42580 [Pseudomonas sp. KU43P]
MSAEDVSYEDLSEQASRLPGDLVDAMAERDGPNEGGLTLTREHIITINQYVNHVFALPSDLENIERWLGYKKIADPELMPKKWEALFQLLRTHAGQWSTLSDNSKKLSSELASTAVSIDASGQVITEECKRIRALGNAVETWDKVALGTPVALSNDDKRTVTQLVEYMEVLREDVVRYASRVESVKSQTSEWRNEIKFKLIPEVAKKNNAVERELESGEAQQLRKDLADLDEEIAALRKEYDNYIKGVMGSAAAGPLGLLIGGAIYGAKAEKARKERKKREGERKAVARQLEARVKMEGSLRQLDQFVDDLDFRLASVLIAAAHLQTAWDTVDSYIVASIDKLGKLTDNKSLARFMIYFRQFLGQWSSIEKTSRQLTRIFDEATAAK